jgi:hypothetical protein
LRDVRVVEGGHHLGIGDYQTVHNQIGNHAAASRSPARWRSG